MNEIDKRVVQMEFDNKKFEQNVSETIKSLQKLDEALKINSSSEGLENTGKAAKKLDKELLSVNDTLDDTGKHFSTLEVVGVTALVSLTNAAIKASTRMVSTLNKPLSLAVSGGIARSQNIENAKFMLKGLGVAWKDIADDINYGVKNTAYGLDAAAKVASQLVASNVTLGDNMKNSLRAISGVAAMTNSTYEEIGSIFTTVAGQGKLMTMQLRQLEARGLNVAASLGKVMNKTEAEIRDMVTNGKIGFQEFANAMDEAFGEHAKEANKTFAGALSNTKSALSRLGEAFATPTFEMFRRVLNATIPILDKVKEELHPIISLYDQATEKIGDYLTKFLGSGELLNSLDAGAKAVTTWIAAVRAAFDVVGVKLPNLTEGVKTLTKFFEKMTLDSKQGTRVVQILATVLQTIKLIHAVAKALWKIAFPFLNLIVHALGALFGVSGDFFEIIYQVEGKLIAILDIISSIIASGLNRFISLIISLISKLRLEYVLKGLQLILGVVVALASAVFQLAGILFVIIAGLTTSIPSALQGIFNVFGDLLGGANVISDLIRSVFGKKRKTTLAVDTSGLADAESVDKVSSSVEKLNKKLPETNKQMDKISKSVANTSKEVVDLGKQSDKVVKGSTNAVKSLNSHLDVIKDKMPNLMPPQDLGSSHGDKWRAAYYSEKGISELEESEKDHQNAFERFFKHIVNILDKGKGWIGKAVDGVTDFIILAYNKLSEFASKIDWFKVILASIAAIAGTIIFEILRAIHTAISLLASVSYVAKGFADRSAAAKLHAMVPVILALGVVLTTLMLVIDKVDSDKLIAGMNALTKVITRLGVFAIAITAIYSIASIFGSIASALSAMARIFNVSNMTIVMKPITQFFQTLSSILGLLIGSLLAFSLIFGGEEGKNRFKQAIKQVQEVLKIALITIGILSTIAITFALIFKNMGTTFGNEKTRTTRSLWKTKSTTTGNNPFTAFTESLNALFPVIKQVFKAVIAFAVLNKLFGESAIDKAIDQTVRVIAMAVISIVAVTAMIALLYKVISTGYYDDNKSAKLINIDKYGITDIHGSQRSTIVDKKGLSKSEDIAKFMESTAGVLRSIFKGVSTLMASIAVFAIMNKYLGAGATWVAMTQVTIIAVTSMAAIMSIAAIASKNMGGSVQALEAIDQMLGKLVRILLSISIALSVLAIVGYLTKGWGLGAMTIGFVAMAGLLWIIFDFLKTVSATIAYAKPYSDMKDGFKGIRKLISEAIIPLVLSLVGAYIAILAVSSITNTSGWKMAAIFAILAGMLYAIAKFIESVSYEAWALNAKQIKNVERLILSAISILTVILAGVALMAVTVIALNNSGVKPMAYVGLSVMLGFVVAIFAVIALTIDELVKHNELQNANIRKVSSFIETAAALSSALIACVLILAGTLILLEQATITGRAIKIFNGIMVLVLAIFTAIALFLKSITDTSTFIDNVNWKKVLSIFTAMIAGLVIFVGLVVTLAQVAKTINTGVNTFEQIMYIGMLCVAVSGMIWIINQAFIALVAAFNSGKISVSSVLKSMTVYLFLVGGLVTIISVIPTLAAAAEMLKGVDLSPILALSSFVAVIGAVYGLIALAVAKSPNTGHVMAAIIVFGLIQIFFVVFAFTMNKIADALATIDETKWSSYGKLTAIYGTYVGIFAFISAIAALAATFISAAWPVYAGLAVGLVVLALITEFFEETAEAVKMIADAAVAVQGIDIKALDDLLRYAIFSLLPIITADVLVGVNNLGSFVDVLATSVNQLNNAAVGPDSNLWNWFKFTDLIEALANTMPMIEKLFADIDVTLSQKIFKIGEGLQALANTVKALSDTSKMASMSRSAEALKKLFNSLADIDITKTVDDLTKFKDVLIDLAPLMVAAAAAMFVAAIIFSGAFATLSVGPIMFVGALALAFGGLNSDNGALGAFRSFVGDILAEGDGLIGALGRILNDTYHWTDAMGVALSGAGVLLGGVVGGMIGGPAGMKIGMGAAIGVEAGLSYVVNDIIDAVAPAIPELPSMESADALSNLQSYRKWDEDKKKWVIDLGDASTEELEAMLVAFTDEYREGEIQSSDQVGTIISLMGYILDEVSSREDADPNVLALADPDRKLNDIGKIIYEVIRDDDLRNRLLTEMRDQFAQGYTFIPDPNLRNDLEDYFHDMEDIGLVDFDKLGINMTSDEFLAKLDEGLHSFNDLYLLEDISKVLHDIYHIYTHTHGSYTPGEATADYYKNKYGYEYQPKVLRNIYNRIHTPGEATAEFNKTFAYLDSQIQNLGEKFITTLSTPSSNAETNSASIGSASIGNAQMNTAFSDIVHDVMSNSIPTLSKDSLNISTAAKEIVGKIGGDPVKGGSMMNYITELAQQLWDYIRTFVSGLADKVPDWLVEGIQNGDYGQVLQQIIDTFGGDVAGSEIGNFLDGLTDMFGEAGYDAGLAYSNNLGDTLLPRITQILEEAFDMYRQGFGQMTASLDTVFGTMTREEAQEAGMESNWLKYQAYKATEEGAVLARAWLRSYNGQRSTVNSFSGINEGNRTVFDPSHGLVYYVDENGNMHQIKKLNDKTDWSEIDAEVWNAYGQYFSSNSGETTNTPPGTTDSLANNVSKSSGTGSGINDISKGGLGGNTGSITNIDSNNVTYNYTQNNYSPEALSRIDIYRQTNNQLKTVFDALKG